MKMFGLDTETPLGRLKVIATNEEVKEVETFEDVLSFLMQKKHRGAFFFLFNLSYDTNHILKLTNSRKFLNELNEATAWTGAKYREGVYMKYIPGKIFKLCKDKHCITFIDIATFYKGMSLNAVAKKYFNDEKDPIDSERLGEEPGYYERHKEEVLKYCQKDAELTLKAAVRMKDLIETCKMPKGKLSFENPISSAKIAEIYVKQNFKYPMVPEGMVKRYHLIAAQQAYHGGLFETFQRGVFEEKLYQYDINSAYPAIMKDLPHWANGRFKPVETPGDGEYGWYYCEFDCEWMPHGDFGRPYEVEMCFGEDSNCEKLMINPKRKVYPIGKRKGWITKMEYEWMQKQHIYCEFEMGIEWYFKEELYPNPFGWIPEVYTRRQEVKALGYSEEYALKIVMNGVYGKTAQFKKGMGKLTNFFYCSYITAWTRLMVASVAIKYPLNLIEIATDSVLLNRKVDLPLSKKLGEWGLDEYYRGILVGSGIHQFFNEEGFVTHARGLTNNPKWDMEIAMHKYSNKDHVWFCKKKPIQFKEMLMHTKALKYEDLGVFKRVSKRLSCNTDKKRVWERDYKDFKDFLESPT